MVAILQQLGYLTKMFDQTERSLFEDAWRLLACDDNNGNSWVTLKNLTALLVAIDKIYVPDR